MHLYRRQLKNVPIYECGQSHIILILNSFFPPEKIIQKFSRVRDAVLDQYSMWGNKFGMYCFFCILCYWQRLVKEDVFLIFIHLSLVFFLLQREILLLMLFLNLRIEISCASNEESVSLSSFTCYLTTFKLYPWSSRLQRFISNILIMKCSEVFGILFSWIIIRAWPRSPFWNSCI